MNTIKQLMESIAEYQEHYLELMKEVRSFQEKRDAQELILQKLAKDEFLANIDINKFDKETSLLKYFKFDKGYSLDGYQYLKIDYCFDKETCDYGLFIPIKKYYVFLQEITIETVEKYVFGFVKLPTVSSFIDDMPSYFINNRIDVPWKPMAIIEYKEETIKGDVIYIPYNVLKNCMTRTS